MYRSVALDPVQWVKSFAWRMKTSVLLAQERTNKGKGREEDENGWGVEEEKVKRGRKSERKRKSFACLSWPLICTILLYSWRLFIFEIRSWMPLRLCVCVCVLLFIRSSVLGRHWKRSIWSPACWNTPLRHVSPHWRLAPTPFSRN